ncbi:NACHT, LRR and PYD domains-containing protein 5-like [Strongylocentrotus purpuratus]|uniref:NACHT domain-containing protein n=1 Tax=Strongylocentrotus purpuratus TaxID=7668 RepID=A0A7M7NYJ5_STRPU|nr:NACHT, LRR and PYD domains-containing protein 5-like [Strongylocentrotus purpuratus]
MAERLKTEEVTEPPSDNTPSTSGQTSRQTHGFDDVIITVAKAVSDDGDIRRLGLELGVQIADINRALETNWAGGKKTSDGNVILLQNWAANVTPSEQLPILRAALQAAGLKEIEETCLRRKGEHGEMTDEVQRLREKLQARYIEEFSQVKVSPMDPKSRTWLHHIFVSLILMLGCKGDQKKEIRYEDLFSFIKKKTDKGFITRLAFLGEAGVGKSTLFAKIALDWAMGKCLQDITLLFHESFRDIEDSPFFGDIVMNHFPIDTEITGEWIDKYITENQRKVLVLLDGLDEAKMDIKCPNRKLAIVSIARRERFIDTSVLISSRPFGADQIKSIPKIHEKYSYILVEGFTKENTNEYIKQFFKNDKASASSLIHFINTNSVVSEFMAPFPIFCCMLCNMWTVESKRKTTEKLQTISQLMKEIDFALREQYSSRYTDSEGGYQCHMEKAVEAITKVGRVAFEGLLKNQLIFTKEEMEACDEVDDVDAVMAVACQVGILMGKKRLASKEIRQIEGKQFIQEFCFPHKLLQEHTASLYLASLYNHNRSEFNRILTHKLLNDYKEFRYVLYFTVAHGGEVGKSVLEALCEKVHNMEFIIDCAFECHDSEAIEPVRNLLKTETHLTLPPSLSNAAFLFTLEPIGKEVVRRRSSIRDTLGVSESFEANAPSSDVAAAVGLFTLQNLRGLHIKTERLDDKFYTGMSAAAPQSMVSDYYINVDEF